MKHNHDEKDSQCCSRLCAALPRLAFSNTARVVNLAARCLAIRRRATSSSPPPAKPEFVLECSALLRNEASTGACKRGPAVARGTLMAGKHRASGLAHTGRAAAACRQTLALRHESSMTVPWPRASAIPQCTSVGSVPLSRAL